MHLQNLYVPQEHANADKTILHIFHRAAVGNPLTSVADSDTEDESKQEKQIVID